MAKKALMHVISYTHWDREWYQDFQGYRRRLVHQLDALLELMERRVEYRYFHLDGQTAPLQDYVQVRPGNRERLSALIGQGRVLIGPWFVMPDEGLVSGESLVRNLMLGHRLCRQWGGTAMPVGFVSDVFGHVSQLPQVLAGFGIDCAWLHRGTGCGPKEKTELLWLGADGSETLIAKAFPHTGYQDFKELRDADQAALSRYEQAKLSLSASGVLFSMDGNDHEPARWDTPEAIDRVNGIFTRVQAVHSSLPEYFDQLKGALGSGGRKRLRKVHGELRHESIGGVWNELFHGTGSARVNLKQANDHLEYLLARLAEPLSAWAVRLGAQSQKAFLDLAWQYLLTNHAHDSICGCSIDQVHKDMLYRFDQAHLLGQNVVAECMQDVADRVETAGFAGQDHVVTVFNLASAPAGPVCQLSVELPAGLAGEKEQQGQSLVLSDEQEHPVELEVLGVERDVRAEPFMYKFQGGSPQMRVRIGGVDRLGVMARVDLPALGYRTFRVGFADAPAEPAPAPVKADWKAKSIENDLVRLVARPDGRVDLLDKTTGAWFRGLNEFEDGGDAGHGWDHFYPEKDTLIRSPDPRRCKVTHLEVSAGLLHARLEVGLNLKVPADLVDQRGKPLPGGQVKGSRRSSDMLSIGIVAEFRLVAGSRRVDCRVTCLDSARRHRLRAIFPTGRKADAWYGDTAFDLVRRKIKLPDGKGWKEQPRPEQPIKNLAAVCDDQAGLAVLTRGLNEAGVLDEPDRPIALTLYRKFVERLLNENTADSNSGSFDLEYALLPFTPDHSAPPADLLAQVDLYKLPPLCYTRSPSQMELDKKTSRYGVPNAIDPADHPNLAAVLKTLPPVIPHLPLSHSLVRIDGPAALSTIKLSEDGSATILRLWNPLGRAADLAVRPTFAFTRAFKTDLLENATERLQSRDGAITLQLRAKQIVTLRIE
jgi:alpha-mannosidase/mannosylglycerate hydrolase